MKTPTVENARVLVAGATGYTGRAVVRALSERGVETYAHVRPDSSSLERWSDTFGSLPAVNVVTTPWTEDGVRELFEASRPTHVMALLGTTQKRAKRDAESRVPDTYDAVDYGLTHLLIEQSQATEPAPRFVYLSSIGAREGTNNAYLRARVRVEQELEGSRFDWASVRASLISGSDRDEARPAERAGAVLANVFLKTAGALGAKHFAHRFQPRTGEELAELLIDCAFRDDLHGVLHLDEIAL